MESWIAWSIGWNSHGRELDKELNNVCKRRLNTLPSLRHGQTSRGHQHLWYLDLQQALFSKTNYRENTSSWAKKKSSRFQYFQNAYLPGHLNTEEPFSLRSFWTSTFRFRLRYTNVLSSRFFEQNESLNTEIYFLNREILRANYTPRFCLQA